MTCVDDQIALLERMMLSRECDRRSGLMLRQGAAWFTISSSGHEALAALGDVLAPQDFVFPHYRDRALVMSRGMSVEDIARDLMGKAGSHSAGRSMTSHFSHRPGNVVSLASPTASQCLPASGVAWASVLRGDQAVVVCSLGEASSRQGEFFEALAFAVQNELPVVFLVADNGYGISTSTKGMSPRDLGMVPADRLVVVDGADPDAVLDAGRVAVDRAREGGGPTVLWCELDRLEPHSSSDDHRLYRSADELAEMSDPIARYSTQLVEAGHLTEEWLASTRQRFADEVEQVFRRVADEPVADPKQVGEHLFGPVAEPVAEQSPVGGTIVAAVNRALGAGIETADVIVFGEDVEDPKGGVFGFTKGLGTDQVVNSPLAEATIVGVSIGLAIAGMRPIVELQFVDFAGPAWNQIAAQLTTLRWRTASDWQCPVVMYAPWGAYLPGGGIWHSQSNESLFTHLPGLHVVVPSTPEDAEVAFAQALAGQDPTLVLLPKHLMRRKQEPSASPVPARGARVVREGADVTIVSWGNGIELAAEAAGLLADDGVSAEVIDLRWLVPWDRASVAASLRRTGRLVVVQEDGRTSSFGAGLLSELVSADDEFYSLLAPPRLVSRDDMHVPFHPELERAVLPCADDVVTAVRSVLS
ncbi:thiamine pyrophosphate-dependent enzyme [Lentzea sp. NPDC051213]|uniref:alpha-ketoacid dehydrogenase subunit alpha/beta n=1 Tax=Lentzea sp. NPDC051213 TaxID=3364126 RepID=UPI0037B52E2D